MLTYILLAVCFIVIAMMWTEGLWSNSLTFLNTLFSGLIAWNYFEPLATYLEKNMDSFTYLLDFLSFWLLFVLTFNVLRAATDQISPHKVRFRKPVEQTGRVLFAVATAWLMVCLICASLHFAPLAQKPLRGSFASEPLGNCFAGFSPDRYWLAFVHTRSLTVLGTNPPRQFDPDGEFTIKYATRRAKLEEYKTSQNGALRVKRGR